MRPTIGQVVVRIALLEESGELVSERSNLARDFLCALFQELQQLRERIFNGSQDPLFEGLGWPTFGEVPAERQSIGELALLFLTAALATPSDGPDIKRAAATP